MDCLDNHQLIEAYIKALKLRLDDDFICLLQKEIIRRKIVINVAEGELKSKMKKEDIYEKACVYCD